MRKESKGTTDKLGVTKFSPWNLTFLFPFKISQVYN